MQFVDKGETPPQFLGVFYCLAIALVSHATASFLIPSNPFVLSLIYGALIVNLIGVPKGFVPGIKYSAHQIMQMTIAALGLVTSVSGLMYFGFGLLSSIFIVFPTLALSKWLGKRMNLKPNQVMLIGAGASMSGAPSIFETAMRIEGSEEEIGAAVKGNVVFGLISMLLYSLLFTPSRLNLSFLLSCEAYSILVGSGIDEASYVAGAAGFLGFETISLALAIKIARMFMIGPGVFFFLHVLRRDESAASRRTAVTSYLPLYGMAFLLCGILRAYIDAFSPLPISLAKSWNELENTLKVTILPLSLSIAMVGSGSQVNIREFLRTEGNHLRLAALATLAVGLLSLVTTLIASQFCRLS
jgi:uncharacterized membrane protein YadS